MANPDATVPKELDPGLNKLVHVRDLFNKYGATKGRGPRAEKLGVEPWIVNRIFRRDGTYQGIPSEEQIAKIALVIGCSDNEVLAAFTKDLHPGASEVVKAVQHVVDLMVEMNDSRREALRTLAGVVSTMTVPQLRELVRYSKRVKSEISEMGADGPSV